MEHPTIVSQDEWLAARKDLLKQEKEFTRRRDALTAQRRKMPMLPVEKEYIFDGPNGAVTLGDLFEGRRQLIVYHFMFEPEWEEGCKNCSHLIDTIDGGVVHLSARDTSFAVVSLAPIAKIEAFKARMGWSVPWVSSFGGDFNSDFHVTLDEAEGSFEYNYANAGTLLQMGKIWFPKGEMPGLSVFFKEGGRIHHTYSTYQRGLDPLLNTYNYLDLTPLGRHEENSPGQSWIRHHDRYGA